MIDLYELSQLAAFDRLGTLSRVADEFHISTPSVTRSMQHLEEAFAVSLFNRSKNRIELNENGKMAARAAEKLLTEAEQAVHEVREFDERQRTLVVKSCAPAPLWEMQRILNTRKPDMMVSSAICQNSEVIAAWHDGTCDIAVLPFEFDGSVSFMQENLFVCVPEDHELAKHETLTWTDINGFNFLLRTELGFWDKLCRDRMPSSKFLVQTDDSVFAELVAASSLPCFTTDYFGVNIRYPHRVNIPIADEDAKVTFYASCMDRSLKIV